MTIAGLRRIRRYIQIMRRLSPIFYLALGLLIGFGSAAPAQGLDVTFLNASRDRARAEERQAQSLERLERLERDRARDLDRDRRNAARDARSARRFD